MLTLDRLQQFLRQFPRLTIGLVGDLFLDRYLELEPGVHELSIETGLEAYQITRIRNSPGALGTVLNNLAALGVGRLVPVTVIGDDGHGYDLRRALQALPVDPRHILSDPERLTPTYTKPLRREADGKVLELNRLDIRNRGPLTESSMAALCQRVEQLWGECDGIIVLDQLVESNWGVVNDQVREQLADLSARDRRKLVYVDSRAHLHRFNFGTLKGNRSEVTSAAGMPTEDDAATRRALEALALRTGQTAFCTCGDQGMLVAEPARATTLVPGYRVAGPVDIVGAGDSATSGLVMSLLAGANAEEAAVVGNLVASITVQQLGTTGTATPAQVESRWHEWHAGLTN
ncbi:MAG: PfkB family carbohydrate kinase [Pirellulales bacterium]